MLVSSKQKAWATDENRLSSPVLSNYSRTVGFSIACMASSRLEQLFTIAYNTCKNGEIDNPSFHFLP